MVGQVICLLCLSLLIAPASTYLEFKLVRMPKSELAYSYGVVQCLSDLPVKKKVIEEEEDFMKRLLATKTKHLKEDDSD